MNVNSLQVKMFRLSRTFCTFILDSGLVRFREPSSVNARILKRLRKTSRFQVYNAHALKKKKNERMMNVDVFFKCRRRQM